MMSTFFTSAIIALAATVNACGYFGENYPQWYCDVCGSEFGVEDGSVACSPQNATFDDIAPGPIKDRYNYVDWTGFDVIATNATLDVLPHLKPHSKPNFAKVNAGTYAAINMHIADYGAVGYSSSGGIYSLRFGCALPVLGLPSSCHVNVTAYCQVLTQGSFPPPQYYNYVLNYTNTNILDSRLTLSQGALPYFGESGFCTNFTFHALSTFGQPVDLFMDEVVFNANVNV